MVVLASWEVQRWIERRSGVAKGVRRGPEAGKTIGLRYRPTIWLRRTVIWGDSGGNGCVFCWGLQVEEGDEPAVWGVRGGGEPQIWGDMPQD